jgi:serine/threonine protein kinase
MTDQRFHQGKIIGGYTLEKQIGVGGMGEVWKGRGPDGLPVAIKFAHPQLANEKYFLDFALQEASTALVHPNIVPIVDRLEVDGLPAIVFYFVAGTNLEKEIYGDPAAVERGRPLELDRALAIARDVLGALDYAHQKGLVHRDVKSNNILLEAKTGKALLSDFGLVVDVTVRRMTRLGIMAGSVPYMSPEQIRDNRTVDFRSDIYSFGIVLYEMVTGMLPFRVEPGETEDADYLIKHKQKFSTAVPPSEIIPGLPEGIDRVIAKAMEKSKDSRYGSCQEFAAALDRAMSSTPPKRVVMPDHMQWEPQQPPVSQGLLIGVGSVRVTEANVMRWLPWALIGTSVVVIVIAAWVYFR